VSSEPPKRIHQEQLPPLIFDGEGFEEKMLKQHSQLEIDLELDFFVVDEISW